MPAHCTVILPVNTSILDHKYKKTTINRNIQISGYISPYTNFLFFNEFIFKNFYNQISEEMISREEIILFYTNKEKSLYIYRKHVFI